MCLYTKYIENPKYKPNKKIITNRLSAKIGVYFMYPLNAENASNAGNKSKEHGL